MRPKEPEREKEKGWGGGEERDGDRQREKLLLEGDLEFIMMVLIILRFIV